MEALSNQDSLNASKTMVMVLLQGVDGNGNPTYVYLSLLGSKLHDLAKQIERGKVNLTQVGDIIEQGEGVPPPEMKRKMYDEWFFSHERMHVRMFNDYDPKKKS